MSTRATYTIKTPSTVTTYYIHHDGYPSGAAEYMKAALFCKNQRGSYADMFLRSNDGAEHTGGKDVHGDTEFHYDITEKDDGSITVEQFSIKILGSSARSFVSNGKKDMADFINSAMLDGYRQQIAYYKRENREATDLLPPDKVHKAANGYYTLETARDAFVEAINAYRDYALKFPHYTGNVEGSMRGVQSAFALYASLREAETVTKVA